VDRQQDSLIMFCREPNPTAQALTQGVRTVVWPEALAAPGGEAEAGTRLGHRHRGGRSDRQRDRRVRHGNQAGECRPCAGHAEKLTEVGLSELLRAGVLLCGGVSHMAGILTLSEKVFQVPVAIGHANGISGLAQALVEPEFAAAIGLVKYGTLQQRQPPGRLSLWARISINEFMKKLFAFLR